MARAKKNRFLTPKTAPIVGAAILGVLFIGGVVTNKFTHKTEAPSTVQPADGPTAEQRKQEADAFAEQKKQAIEKTSDPSAQTSPTPSTNDISLTAVQESNGTITVFTKLKNIGNGTCELTVANGSKTTSQKAEVVYQPEYSSCAGFSVAVSSLGTGVWTLTLTVTSNGNTVTKSISQEVR